jgi:hypothetical protein
LEVFNQNVNELSTAYGKLKEVFKQRHFILRDSLTELKPNEIEESILILENWIESNNNEYEMLLKPLIYNSMDVVFATCIGIKTDKIFKDLNFKFNTVIIDEAGKANIAETLVAIELGEKIILVGDQMQLPPYMDSSLVDEREPTGFPKSIYGANFSQDEIIRALKTSFFEFIINRIDAGQFPHENKEMLNYQHRMHPNIGKFISNSFYEGKVEMGSRTHLNKIELPAPFNKEVIFFDTSNMANPYEQTDGYSTKNNTEAEAISEFILPKLFEHRISNKSIAIIAPYKSQVTNIRHFIKNSNLGDFNNLDISTLDSFQGKEYDIIIISFTRSSNHRKAIFINGRPKYTKVGFLDDARRLNVAFSRAKKKLILVGNANTLTDSRSHYDGFFNYTSLFKNIVELSREEGIGNFLNVADFFESTSPFELFINKFKINQKVFGIIKETGISKVTNNPFGRFVEIENFRVLAPYFHNNQIVNRDFDKWDYNEKVVVEILDINYDKKNISVQIIDDNWLRKVLKINIGQSLEAQVVKKFEHGYFLMTRNYIMGSLAKENLDGYMSLEIGESLTISVSEIDYENKKVVFKV